MNSYQRVITALHQQPDKVPFGVVPGFVTAISREAYKRIAAHYLDCGPEDVPIVFYDTKQQLPVIDDRVLQAIGADFRGIIPNTGRKNATTKHHEDGSQTFEDEWGVKFRMLSGGTSFDVVYWPLVGKDEVRDIENFDWPNPEDPALFEGLADEARKYREQGYPVILEDLCQGILEMSCQTLRGCQFFYDLNDRPDYVRALLERLTDLRIRFYKAAGKHLSGLVNCVRYGDDIGTQKSLCMSPDMVEEFLIPRYKRIIQAQREAFSGDFFIFFHCDGAISPLMETFLELGVDVLNPLQRVPSVDIAEFKKKYGDNLCFWGGVDTQHILNKGTVDEVREHVRRTLEVLKPGGGYIFSPSHNIQDDVPLDNIKAMLDEFEKNRDY